MVGTMVKKAGLLGPTLAAHWHELAGDAYECKWCGSVVRLNGGPMGPLVSHADDHMSRAREILAMNHRVPKGGTGNYAS